MHCAFFTALILAYEELGKLILLVINYLVNWPFTLLITFDHVFKCLAIHSYFLLNLFFVLLALSLFLVFTMDFEKTASFFITPQLAIFSLFHTMRFVVNLKLFLCSNFLFQRTMFSRPSLLFPNQFSLNTSNCLFSFNLTFIFCDWLSLYTRFPVMALWVSCSNSATVAPLQLSSIPFFTKAPRFF